MPKFYCDYCDAYLAHDSAAGRKQHTRGWKHVAAFKAHYQNLYPAWAQQHQQQLQQLQQQQFAPQPQVGSYGPYGQGLGRYGQPQGMMYAPPVQNQGQQFLPPPPGAGMSGLPPPPSLPGTTNPGGVQLPPPPPQPAPL